METIVERNQKLQCHPYYGRVSHTTSLAAIMMAVFASLGGLTLGGIVTLCFNGIVVWIASAVGLLAGALVYSLCYVSSRASCMEHETMIVTQTYAGVTETQEA